MSIEQTEVKMKERKNQIINLKFDCYEFYKFIETIEKYVDELEIIFENREFSIKIMDASRIMLCKVSMYLTDYHDLPLEKMKFGINTEDLMKLLKTRKNDKKGIELIFDNSKTFIELIKTSQKFNSKITRTLNLLDLELEEIPMDILNKIEYPAKAIFPTSFLDDLFYECGLYSEVINIEIDELLGISFSEEGQIGKSEYLIKQKYCNEIKGYEKGNYSYTFLTPIKPLKDILGKNDDIAFNIKTDNPIKLEIYLNSLDINLLIYLAPRAEEAEFDDDNDDMDEF